MNVSPQTVESLVAAGWNILRSVEVLPATASDHEILDWARRHERALITQDLDFSALLALGGHSSPSVVTLRMAHTDPDTITSRLLEVLPELQTHLVQGCIATVDEARIRIRSLPIESPPDLRPPTSEPPKT